MRTAFASLPARALLAALVIACPACGEYGFEAEITNRASLAPPTGYGAWWAATEICSGRSGSMERVTWYVASSITSNGRIARGAWSPPHQIVLVRGYEDDELTVRHEMLHDLLDGDPGHRSGTWDTCDLIPD